MTNPPKKAHFIGIAGKGMSATAILLKELGWEISGSDSGFYPPVSDYLKDHHIPFAANYKKENIPKDAEIIVIGKNAKLIPEENEEVKAAFESGKAIRSFPEILKNVTDETDNIVVVGSYGKSTSTALLAHCLKESGKDPSYFIGEVTKGFDAYAHSGKSNVFVLEGDEYPSANWDEASKFLYYNPHSVLLTSLTHDHVNVYPTHESYKEPFIKLLALLPEDGLLVANGDEQYARALAEAHQGKKFFYGFEKNNDWSAENITYGETSSFDLVHKNKQVVRLETSLLGKHNIENIIGISALLLEKQLLTPGELQKTVKTFQGVKRRMELLSDGSSVLVFEGFGSSFEKAKAAYESAKLHFPNNRLITVFEPHTFSWRNRASLLWYDSIFNLCDKIYIYHPATQGAKTHDQLSQEEIVERVRKTGKDVEAVKDNTSLLKNLSSELKAGDVVLLMTSGDLGGLIVDIPALVEKQFPK